MEESLSQGYLAASPAANGGHETETGTAPDRHDLIRRQEQYEALAMPLSGALFATALRWCGNRAQAEDLVQETMLCAWRNFERFELGTNFKAWVFQILRFTASNSRRTAKSREVTIDFMEDESLLVNPPRRHHEPEPFSADWDEIYPGTVDDELKHALDRLSPDQRAVTLRIPLGGLSYQECADELGVCLGTIMSRYSRARARLKKELTFLRSTPGRRTLTKGRSLPATYP
jgi:RNA polymerase sigma-70 factor (ECF subfamily)